MRQAIFAVALTLAGCSASDPLGSSAHHDVQCELGGGAPRCCGGGQCYPAQSDLGAEGWIALCVGDGGATSFACADPSTALPCPMDGAPVCVYHQQ